MDLFSIISGSGRFRVWSIELKYVGVQDGIRVNEILLSGRVGLRVDLK